MVVCTDFSMETKRSRRLYFKIWLKAVRKVAKKVAKLIDKLVLTDIVTWQKKVYNPST